MKKPLFYSLDVSRIGVFSSHEKDLVIDRPGGSSDFLFLHFPEPMRVMDATGTSGREEDACIVYGPKSPQWYTPVHDDMLHHFIHFKGADAGKLLNYAGIPVNTVFYPQETLFICQYLSMILTEHIIEDPYHREISSLLLEIFLLRVGRSIALVKDQRDMSAEDRFNRQRLETVREEMKDNPGADWSVESMAERVHMSTSHFYAVYRQTFGTSPMRDLETFRMRLARRKLVDTTDTISSIAQQCGYANVYYFSNVFKKYHGSSPKNYRHAILYSRTTVKPGARDM
jgi:AraC family transcriptional regulator of arabinose operon